MNKKLAHIIKHPLFWILTAFFFVAIIIVLIFALNKKPDTEKKVGTDIVFDFLFKPDPDTEFVYDAKAIEANLPSDKSYYVYYDVVIDDYSTAEALGFDENTYTEENGFRVYSKADIQETLKIDRFGRFVYEPFNAVVAHKNNDNGRYNYLLEIIHKCGLDGNIQDGWSTHGDVVNDENGKEKVIIRSMDIYANDISDGNITTSIDENGSISRIECNFYKYGEKQKADLISVKEAIKRIKKGKAKLTTVDEKIARLEFEEVLIKYVPQDTADGNRMLQPVYEFSGTSVLASGETDTFVATVQANKF